MPRRAAFLFLLVGCACSATPQQQASSPRGFQEASLAPSRTTKDAEPSLVSVAKDIREACGIDDSRAFFAYNSARVVQQDRLFFAKLAACFADGPLSGRTLRLVGHADPRGDTDYNYVLGQQRADGVRDAVVGAGLASERVSTTSRGELEAQGGDEPSWAKDRRVDLVLGES
jgi:peptidoglycan-associated lipoprotein